MPDPNPIAPRVGPCAPWIDAEVILANPRVIKAAAEQPTLTEDALIADATLATSAATGILYQMSGKQFTGACGPVTVRPVARPVDADSRTWGLGVSPFGWYSGWGTCLNGLGGANISQHYGCSRPPEVELGAYPVTEVTQVLIDGVVIPSNEYQLQDYRVLKRMRVNLATPPTERYGWPTCQSLDLPDTEEGTFSITYTYGIAPPDGGVMAVTALSLELTLAMIGSPNRLPSRITTMTRQGIGMAVVDVMDFLKQNLSGIYEVDLWLRSVNPGGGRRPSLVYSPDLGRARRDPRSS